jgi:hypothetical protein
MAGTGPSNSSTSTALDAGSSLVAFVAEAILAGGNSVAIRISNRELDPLWGRP